MNKAFVREREDTGEMHCPACDSLGVPVTQETWEAHVNSALGGGLASTAFFCPYARCDVVYFDMFERRVTTEGILHGVYPKDAQAPICGCFGLTASDVEADVSEGTPTRIRALLAKSKSPQANCRRQSPSGQCCTAEVQRYYMKLRGQR